MLQITIPKGELWDELNNEFLYTDEIKISMEHSLVSLSKWESKWHKPFLQYGLTTPEEELDYVRCMTLTKNVDPMVYSFLTNESKEKINNYIEDPMTATWFRDDKTSKNKKASVGNQIVTAELIYYWMISYNIPFECQYWHLSKLMTLIRVCEEENKRSSGKVDKNDILRRNRELNEIRRKKYAH